MSDQEEPMRTTVKPVHEWTSPDGENPRRRKIGKWLFGAMFLWPVILLACDVVAKGMHNESPYYIAAYIGSPLYATILIVTALCEYPALCRFLKWLAGTILVIATYWGVAYYFDSLQHGWKWVESATKSPIVWLDGVLVILSTVYLAVPQRAWGWTGDALRRAWSAVWRRKSM